MNLLLCLTEKDAADHICSTSAKNGPPQSISEGTSDKQNGEIIYKIMGLFNVSKF